MSDLKGKVVLVTGASSGIGEAIARDLAAQGCKLMLTARRVNHLQSLSEKLGNHVAYKAADVSDAEEMKAVAGATVERFGRIDVLVNNAGVMPMGNLDEVDVATWHKVIDINVKGVLHGVAAVLPHMIGQGCGHVVNVGSVGSLVVTPGNVVYCASKHAVRALSEGLRQEQAGRVRVTQINPGAVESEILEASNDAEAAERTRKMLDSWIPASSIAAAVRFSLEQPEDVSVNEITIRPSDQKV